MNFTPKTEEQLAWDFLKAAVRAKVGLEVAAYRNRRVNDELGELWPAFRAALAGEVILEVDPETETWVRDAVAQLEAGSEASRV
jgi:hypothetical protein